MKNKTPKNLSPVKPLHPKTLSIHGDSSLTEKELRPSINRVVAYGLGPFNDGADLFSGKKEGLIYTRIGNKTVDKLEKRIASLEGAEAALATSSGMAAIALLSMYLAHGGHIVASNRLYGGVFNLFKERLPALGIPVTFVDNPHDIAVWKQAIRKKTRGTDRGLTKFLYVESPSNPVIEAFDIFALADLAHAHGIPLVVDSTLATPVLLRPLAFKADIVIHSLSKYMGDGEVIGGIICGTEALIKDLRLTWFRDLGPCISPDNASILCKNLESIHVRMREHCRNAMKIVSYLARHSKVQRVFYPTEGPKAKDHLRLMPDGFGGLMSFEVKGGIAEAQTVEESLNLFWHAANIGEARSLVIHPATTTHGQMSPKERIRAGISDSMLRLSIGCEDHRDLIADLKQALGKI